ncbi:ATP-dependent helicase [Candidatus Poribacteria bacterium]|nr:MAG: ATP-dependent helicase [Candidatus Poribacteria bacterium]
MRKDREVEKYAEHRLYITWARVKSSSLDDLIGIWSYLCKELEPLVGPRCPQVDATQVVLPWTPIKEASGASAIKQTPTPEPTAQQQEASGASAEKQTPTSGPNPQQQEAIQTTEGPLLIIAGPGSGKTFTLVERVYHLISKKGIQPERLFVSTFTEKAAAELITRVSSRLEEDNITVNLNETYIGTFHSICLRFLEEHRDATRLNRNFTLLDQFDQQYFLYQHLSDYQKIEGSEYILENTRGWWGARKLMTWVNKVSEEALDLEVLLNAPEPEVQALGRCYQQYQKHLEEENYLDFSTIQVEALRLLEGHPEILDDIRENIQYLMVDEYQDTNTIQERILFALAKPDFNLCVVGDDDQGLYRFRGATIRNILEFPQQFSAGVCKQVSLTTNYRSHPDIIEFYNKWMETLDWTADGKTFRYEKEIVPEAETDFTDMPAALKIAGHNTQTWHKEVLAFLYRLRDSGALTDWNQVAFLFRSVKNRQAVALAAALEADGIPVYSPRSNQFFDREEIRLMIGALIFLFPQFPEVRQWREGVWLDIWDYYDEACVREFVTELRRPENQPLLTWSRRQARTHRTLTEGTDYAFSGLFYELLQFPLFSQYLGDVTQGNVIDSRPARNLAIFSQLLHKYEYLHHINVLTPDALDRHLWRLFNQFFRFLKDGGIDEYEDASEYAPSGCVSFMTIHQSKGLEFPVVIVGSMEITPSKQYSYLDERLQENYYTKEPFEPLEETKNYDFWRLFYTAFSRAQNLLLLTCQEQMSGRRVPSLYFKPVYDLLPPWRTPSFQPDDLTLKTIKDVDLKNAYSFTSHITVFENCARQYKFYRSLGFAPIRRNPILFGILVHQTIEDIHKAVLRGEENRITKDKIEDWFAANYAHLSHQERLYLSSGGQKAALDHVLRYAHRERGTWDRLHETEVEVSLVKDAYLLKGHVDLIRGEDNTVEIVDFKSEKKPDLVNERERIDRHRRQLEVYAHIIEGRTGQEISKMHLYYTGEDDGNPYVSFDKDTRSIEQTMATFDGIVARIENKDFEITARPDRLCRNCDMQAYCDAM